MRVRLDTHVECSRNFGESRLACTRPPGGAMSLKYLLTTAAVSLGVVVAFEKFRGKAA